MASQDHLMTDLLKGKGDDFWEKVKNTRLGVPLTLFSMKEEKRGHDIHIHPFLPFWDPTSDNGTYWKRGTQDDVDALFFSILEEAKNSNKGAVEGLYTYIQTTTKHSYEGTEDRIEKAIRLRDKLIEEGKHIPTSQVDREID